MVDHTYLTNWLEDVAAYPKPTGTGKRVSDYLLLALCDPAWSTKSEDAGSLAQAVMGATKNKVEPPKKQYIDDILAATYSGQAEVEKVFKTLVPRLHNSKLTVKLKCLITIHLMIREGCPGISLKYLNLVKGVAFAIAIFHFGPERNIRNYAYYFMKRAQAYKDTEVDWVRVADRRLETLSVWNGLLEKTEAVQYQVAALLKCDARDYLLRVNRKNGFSILFKKEPEATDDVIAITILRLLTLDLLALYYAQNGAIINTLENFFKLSKPDSKRALAIYHTFVQQTQSVVRYLSVAREYKSKTRVEIPKIKHAPVNLGNQLDEYVHDPDFEVHRRRYLAEEQAKNKAAPTKATPREALENSDSSVTSSLTKIPPRSSSTAVADIPKPSAHVDPNHSDLSILAEQSQTSLNISSSPRVPSTYHNTPRSPITIPAEEDFYAAPIANSHDSRLLFGGNSSSRNIDQDKFSSKDPSRQGNAGASDLLPEEPPQQTFLHNTGIEHLPQERDLKPGSEPSTTQRNLYLNKHAVSSVNSSTEPELNIDKLKIQEARPNPTVLDKLSEKSPPAMQSQVSDLIRDSKLVTLFNGDVVRHISHVSDMAGRRRKVKKEVRWKKQRELGSGAYGRVWLQECMEKGEDQQLRAVKELARRGDKSNQVDLERELEAIAKFSNDKVRISLLNHAPSALPQTGIKLTDWSRYLTRPLTEVKAREITSQLLEGLSLMHENGFVHRDLKPGNILVSQPSPDWWVKIGDFGISKRVVEENTALRTMVGTKGYLAPEVFGMVRTDDDYNEDDHDSGSGSGAAASSYTSAVDI
ncbi:hypothetical protein BX600DRAFT_492614 [Xylariales sp. PMI_506]|nr:hypothetical protein BX600DRAFT_492614 [Xylariales sp. PMI_506]